MWEAQHHAGQEPFALSWISDPHFYMRDQSLSSCPAPSSGVVLKASNLFFQGTKWLCAVTELNLTHFCLNLMQQLWETPLQQQLYFSLFSFSCDGRHGLLSLARMGRLAGWCKNERASVNSVSDVGQVWLSRPCRGHWHNTDTQWIHYIHVHPCLYTYCCIFIE